MSTTGLLKFATGTNSRLAFLVQAAAGAIDATPAWLVLPFTSCTPEFNPNRLENNAMAGHRDMLKSRSGTVNATLQLDGRLYPGTYDKLIEAGMQGTWAAKYTEALGAVTVAVDATAKTFTRSAGSWLTLGVQVGDEVTFSGFTVTGPPDETPNNGTFVVSTVTETVITCATATGLVNTAVPQASVTVTTPPNYLKTGSTKRKIAIEIFHSDAGTAGEYVRMVDLEVASIGFPLDAEGNANINISLVGGTELDLGAAIGDPIAGATYTNPTKDYFDSFSGYVKLDSTDVAVVTSLSPNLDNQSNPLFVIGSRYPAAVDHGKSNVGFDAVVFYQDSAIKAKFQTETDVALEFEIRNNTGANYDGLMFYYPKCEITNYSRPISGEGVISQNLTLRPYRDDTLGSSLRLRRTIAA